LVHWNYGNGNFHYRKLTELATGWLVFKQVYLLPLLLLEKYVVIFQIGGADIQQFYIK
jgi:hypothetical protein